MLSRVDDIVKKILNELVLCNYNKVEDYYLSFINQVSLFINDEINNYNMNLIKINSFLENLNNAYVKKDIILLWDLFRYEYWNVFG